MVRTTIRIRENLESISKEFFLRNSITTVSVMGTSRELHHTSSARYEKVTGFDKSEPSGLFLVCDLGVCG